MPTNCSIVFHRRKYCLNGANKASSWKYSEESFAPISWMTGFLPKKLPHDKLLKHFDTSSLKGFGVSNLRLGIIAAGAILQYLDITEHNQVKHITSFSRIQEDHYVWLDKFTVRNLELFHPLFEGGKAFIDIIDRTISPMGARLMKRWVAIAPERYQTH